MHDRTGTIAGAATGAGVAYFFDPEMGRRRRALLRDRAVRVANRLDDAFGATVRDASNRIAGAASEARSLMTPDAADDAVIGERVRAELGLLVSHPSAIEVDVSDGVATLRGPVLADEASDLLAGVRRVRGVADVVDRLDVHPEPGNVPGLQGEPSPRRRRAGRPELLQEHWSPATRAAAAGAGGMLVARGLRRRGLVGTTQAAAGGLLALRSVTDRPLRVALGMTERRSVDVQDSITVGRPVGDVFAFWSAFENFPRFMANVRDVRRTGEDRSVWTVAGPGGADVRFEAVTTRIEPDREIAWKTAAGAAVGHAGRVRFDPVDGGTRVQVRMTYRPPAGAVGHALVSLFGSDPRRLIEQDLLRMKTFLETGRPAHDAAGSAA